MSEEKGKPCGKSFINARFKCKLNTSLQYKPTLSYNSLILHSDPIIERKIRAEEETIRHQNYETVIVIDNKTGRSLYRKDGNQNSVDIDQDVLKHLKGNVVTHNHPTASIVPDAPAGSEITIGSSFSLADIKTASYFQVKEMRATSSGYTYTMNPPKNKNWDANFFEKKVNPSYQKHLERTRTQLTWDVLLGRTKITPSGHTIDLDPYHQIWEKVAKETGLQYKREYTDGSQKTLIANINKQRNLPRKDSLNESLFMPNQSNWKVQTIINAILARGTRNVIRQLNYTKIGQSLIKGTFLDGKGLVFDFSLDINTNNLEYKINRSKTPLNLLRTDAIAKNKTRKPKCIAGFSCGDTCIAKNKSCKLNIQKLASPQEIKLLKDNIGGGGEQSNESRFRTMTIRQLQEIAREQGVYRTNHRSKQELIQILELLERQMPENEEALRKTLNKREKELYLGPITTKEVRAKKQKERTLAKVIDQFLPGAGSLYKTFTQASTLADKTIASALVSSALLGITMVAYNNQETNYSKNLKESEIEAERLSHEELAKIETEDLRGEEKDDLLPNELLAIIDPDGKKQLTTKDLTTTFAELEALANDGYSKLNMGSRPRIGTKEGFTPYQGWLLNEFYAVKNNRVLKTKDSNGKLVDDTWDRQNLSNPNKPPIIFKLTEAHEMFRGKAEKFSEKEFKKMDTATYVVGGLGHNTKEMTDILKSYEVFEKGERVFNTNKFRQFNEGSDGGRNVTNLNGYADMMFNGYRQALTRSLHLKFPNSPLFNASSGNPEAIRLAAQLYARGQMGETINLVAGGEGGILAREALEIVRLMPKGVYGASGSDIAAAIRFVSLGTPLVGPMGKLVVETNIVSENDPIPKVHKQTATKVRNINTHNGVDYLKNGQVKSVIESLFAAPRTAYKRGRR